MDIGRGINKKIGGLGRGKSGAKAGAKVNRIRAENTEKIGAKNQ